MRVLVTGASAPLGLALIDHLLREPAVEHVLAVGLESRPPPELVDSARVTYCGVDLTPARAVHDLLFGPVRVQGIDTIVHGALHRNARDVGHRIHATNVEITRRLLLGCERHPTVRKLVYRSAAEVYAVRATEPNLLDEDAPLELAPSAPQWVRDRVEGDLVVCARMGMSRLSIMVLRCAEVLAPGTGSQLWDYLKSRVCFRPLGFDPMINVLSIEDHARAHVLAARTATNGVFNIIGADTLPLSQIIAHAGRTGIPVPGPLLAPLYSLRAWTIGLDFRYDLNMRRFHFGGILDGRRAADQFGYRPSTHIWESPRPESHGNAPSTTGSVASS